MLTSYIKQFVPGSTSEALITSADSRIRVINGTELVHKLKGILAPSLTQFCFFIIKKKSQRLPMNFLLGKMENQFNTLVQSILN